MALYNRQDYKTALPQLEKEFNARFDGLLDFFYPVGCYFETSDTKFDPNKSWGGKWELETEGQVHISAGENYEVDGALDNATDGGESTHQLSMNEMPSHNHNQRVIDGTVSSFFGSGQVTTTSGPITKGWVENRQYQTNGTSYNAWYSLRVNATHTHDSQGGGGEHNNMQPYIIVNRWHRVK